MFEHMCHGDPGRIYVRAWDKVHELDCSKLSFTGPVKSLHTDVAMCDGMCYTPSSHKALILSDTQSIMALSVSDNKTLWEVSGCVDGECCQPMGLLYSPKHKSLLVCDGWNHRILVLDLKNGSHIQTVSFNSDVGDIKEMSFYEGNAVMCHMHTTECVLTKCKKCTLFCINASESMMYNVAFGNNL